MFEMLKSLNFWMYVFIDMICKTILNFTNIRNEKKKLMQLDKPL